MSGLVGEAPRPREPREGPGRSRTLLITTAVILGGFFALTALSSLWTEQLWFSSVGYSTVFWQLVWTKVGLFVVFGGLMALVVGVNMLLAFRLRPVPGPPPAEQTSLAHYREAVTPIRRGLWIGISLLIGFFGGLAGAGQWRSFMLWRDGVSFDKTDPFLHRDIGFYVFDLPWWHFLTDFTMVLAVLSLIASAGVHYLYGGILLPAKQGKVSGAAASQLSVLLGIFMVAKAADYWLDRFDILTSSGRLIDGMTYTDDHALLPAKNVLLGIAAICALLLFVNVWRRAWMLPSLGLGLFMLSAILFGMIWPGLVQQFRVDPTEADKEAPYIAHNIEATRAAYDIEDAVVELYSGESELEPQELAQAAIDSPGIRLVDPQVVQQTFEQRQQVRGYYTVAPVLDVDNYEINGQERDVVLAVRELNQDGISSTSQNWANLHTVYTHGYGVVAVYGNQRPADNETVLTGQEPAWAEIDIPPRGQLTDLTEEGYEGRIYFGENSPSYSIVGKRSEDAVDIELDLPGDVGSDADRTTTYDGEDGVPVGGLFNKLLYAVKFGEPNLVLSERVHENSKILYHRDPALRVEKVAPWLTVDSDPYPAVVDGRVLWLLDGYTVTDHYPMSEKGSFSDMTDDALANDTAFQTLPSDEINYIRNAVKATVDAYDGEVNLYAWDENDPILRAWMDAFPGTVQPRSDIPEAVLEHLRYPEDMFKVQRYQLGAYHVIDAGDFYEANDRWRVPTDPNNPTSLQPPYRLSVPSPGSTDMFSLTSVYTPVNRENLAAFVSVDADAAVDSYGTIRVKRLSSSSQIPGPGQIANQIQSDQAVTQALLPYTRETNTRVVNGNLLTLPVGGGLLYVQPLYSLRTSGEGNFPVLRFVAVSFGQDVGVGRTLGEAIYSVLDLRGIPSDSPAGRPPPDSEEPSDPGGETTGSLQDRVQTLLDRAHLKFEEADSALAEGDLGRYQDAVTEARALVQQAIDLVAAAQETPATPEAG